METGKKSHRDRKNGAAHEAWMKRKAAANAARPKQTKEGQMKLTNVDNTIILMARYH